MLPKSWLIAGTTPYDIPGKPSTSSMNVRVARFFQRLISEAVSFGAGSGSTSVAHSALSVASGLAASAATGRPTAKSIFGSSHFSSPTAAEGIGTGFATVLASSVRLAAYRVAERRGDER